MMTLLNRRTVVFMGVCMVLAVSTHWFTVHISPSVPYGLYRKMGSRQPLVHGDLVLGPAVPFGRSWLHAWLPWLKPIAGMPGDQVCVKPDGLWVHDAPYGAVYQTWRGQALPVFWGCHTVGSGEVFVASPQPKSLDGRYFGMTRVDATTLAVPIWTWE
jgi:type IV secretory pathway protease TraF